MCHQDSKGHKVETGESLVQACGVACKTTEARHPGEGAFDNPASGQEDEAALGLVQLDDIEVDAVLSGGVGDFFAGVALVDKDRL